LLIQFIHMKFLPFLFSAACLFSVAACKNDASNTTQSTTSTETTPAAVQAPPPPSAETIAETMTAAKSNLSAIEQLYDKIGKAIDAAKGEKAQQLFALRTELQGMMSKQQMMVQMVEPIQNGANGKQDPNANTDAGNMPENAGATIADVKESGSRYAEALKDIEKRFNDIMSK
jgi:hypothetical protein